MGGTHPARERSLTGKPFCNSHCLLCSIISSSDERYVFLWVGFNRLVNSVSKKIYSGNRLGKAPGKERCTWLVLSAIHLVTSTIAIAIAAQTKYASLIYQLTVQQLNIKDRQNKIANITLMCRFPPFSLFFSSLLCSDDSTVSSHRSKPSLPCPPVCWRRTILLKYQYSIINIQNSIFMSTSLLENQSYFNTHFCKGTSFERKRDTDNEKEL